MAIRINTVASSVFLALLLASVASADAEDPRAASERRWAPALAIWSGFTVQNQDATATSRCAQGGPQTTLTNGTFLVACSLPQQLRGPANMRPPVQNNENVVSPLVGASLQLSTPTFEFVPFRPRIFGSAELITYFSPKRKIAREGAPSGVHLPANIDLPENASTVSLLGRGSETTSQVQLLGYGAKLGLAFPFELFGRRLWIKPAAGWTRYEVDIDGIVIHAIKDDFLPPTRPPPASPQYGENVRIIQLLGNDSLVLNGIGPGGELELEVGRFGPLGANVFLDVQAYRLFGDRNVSFSSTVSLTGPPRKSAPLKGLPSFGPDTYTANWEWEADPWLWRTSAGIRIQWLGR